MNQLSKITLRLARNPDAGFPDGDPARGYILTAPLDAAAKLDLAGWRAAKAHCTVIRFSPEVEEKADGWLSHRGAKWFFRYDEEEEGPDEPVFRLGDHVMRVGEYVTIHEAAGDDLVYRVAEVSRV